MKRTEAFERYLALGCGFLLMLCSGFVFSWSIFAKPIELDLSFTRQQTSLVFPFSLSISIFGQMLAGYLQKKIGLRYNFFITAILSLSGFWMTAQSKMIWQIYLGYGVFVGLAIGMLFNAVLINVPAFSLPQNESLGTGIVLMGFGMGSMVLGTLAAKLIQISGWRMTFMHFAAGYAVLCLLGAGVISPARGNRTFNASEHSERSLSPLKVLKLASYRTFFIWSIFLIWGSLVVAGHAALCAAELTPDPIIASTAVTANAMANILSRIAFGYGYSHLGERKCRWGLVGFAFVGSLISAFSYSRGSLGGLLLGFAFLGAVNGGSAVVSTTYLRERYGRTHFGSIVAMTNLHLAVASFIGPAVAGAIRTQSGSYSIVFIAMILISIAALILLYLNIRQEKQELLLK